MKKFILLCFALCLSVGCDKSDSKYAWEKSLTVVIASVRPVETWCLGVGNGEKVPPLYICKKDGAVEWSIWWEWSPIRGFDEQYEEGYEYVIEVSEKMFAEFPVDSNPYVYDLKTVISKERRDSEGIPEEYLKEQ